MAKNIWYLHHYAGAPDRGMSYRPYYLARHFIRLGLRVSVIASSFHHLLLKPQVQHSPLSAELIDDVPYIWIKTNAYQENGLRRLQNMFTYTAQLRIRQKALVDMAGKPDVIIVSSTHPFHYLTARKIAKIYDARLIFEVRDLWPLSLIELLGVSPRHPLLRLMSYIEKKAYQESDYVVSLLPNALEYMVALGLDEHRYVYIPNGVDSVSGQSCTPLPAGLAEKIRELKTQNKLVIVYAGAHGIPNALEQFIDALKILQEQGLERIYAVLVGNGVVKTSLQEKARHLKNIFFHDAIPKTAVPQLLAQSDACFVGWRDKDLYRYGISANKIFDYMLSGKPIIQAINTLKDPVAVSGCGIIVPAEQPVKLAEAMETLANMDRGILEQLGAKGKEYVLKHHDYAVLAQRYLELF